MGTDLPIQRQQCATASLSWRDRCEKPSTFGCRIIMPRKANWVIAISHCEIHTSGSASRFDRLFIFPPPVSQTSWLAKRGRCCAMAAATFRCRPRTYLILWNPRTIRRSAMDLFLKICDQILTARPTVSDEAEIYQRFKKLQYKKYDPVLLYNCI